MKWVKNWLKMGTDVSGKNTHVSAVYFTLS